MRTVKTYTCACGSKINGPGYFIHAKKCEKAMAAGGKPAAIEDPKAPATGSTGVATKANKAKPAAKKAPKEPKEKKEKKLSLVGAALQVLKSAKEPLNCKAIVAKVRDLKLWDTKAPTPDATLYSAIKREIDEKGKESRFVKTDRGLFAIAE